MAREAQPRHLPLRERAGDDDHRDEGERDGEDDVALLAPFGEYRIHRNARSDQHVAIQRRPRDDDRRLAVQASGRAHRFAGGHLAGERRADAPCHQQLVGRHAREQLTVVALEADREPRDLHGLRDDGRDQRHRHLGHREHALAVGQAHWSRKVERTLGGREVHDRRADRVTASEERGGMADGGPSSVRHR